MAEYRITDVDVHNVREWDGPNGKVFYIPVMVEGHSKWISIGKKSKDALNKGDTIYGTIEETEYATDKFKAEKQFQQRYDGPKKGYTQRDDSAIRAQWAIGQAVQLNVAGAIKFDGVEETAKLLYAMVDRVKASEPESEQSALDALAQ